MSVISSVGEQRTFVPDVAGRRDEIDVKANDAHVDWVFEGMISANELANTGVRRKVIEIQRICKKRSKTVPTAVLEVIDLSREVVKTKSSNAKLMGRTYSLVIELDESGVSKCLSCDRVQKAEAHVKAGET